MTVLRSFFLTLMLVLSHLVQAEFVELPKVPDFSELQTHEEAIHRLFQGKGENFEMIRTAGGELDRAYTALFDGTQWFIKIFREDCSGCEQIRFESEWLLKKKLPLYTWLFSVNAELVLPDRAATFILNRKQHYILSYPLVPGMNLRDIYYQYYHASPYSLNTRQKALLSKAFYRYGQVLALAHFDPKRPAKNIAEMWRRMVRLHLPDRNGNNEIYDQESDRIYLVDLAETIEDFGEPVYVREDLKGVVGNLAEMASDAQTGEGFYCGAAYDCIVNPLRQFALGYASSLPFYNRKMIITMIGEAMVDYLREECLGEMQGDRFCHAVEIIQQQYLSAQS
ncbi:hypothetical protein [Endozoicomonas sp. 8E]|uniref:hypothetical protein n=1 Tax=Endozoicomonas sp. 8E TaxID=3035692 RepID=UPI002938E1C2|nr:hypothetical protein [Endozoicomonas sp. 8E]WOG26356.1 hypothetical protein P6910_17545 [Endozoicomonas sp. 8E]